MAEEGKIGTLYAWVRTEPGGREALCTFAVGVTHIPMVGSDRGRVVGYKPIAQHISRRKGCPVSLKMYDCGVTIDVVT